MNVIERLLALNPWEVGLVFLAILTFTVGLSAFLYQIEIHFPEPPQHSRRPS